MMIKRLFLLFLVCMLVLTACGTATLQPTATLVPSPVPPTATPVPPTATPLPPVLELVGTDGASQSLTLDDIKALPVTEGMAGIKSSTGKITPPTTFKGVALKDLVTLLAAFDDTMGLSVEASDGYAITFSYDQILNGTFTEYDPGTGDELKSPVPLTAMLAYEMDGQLLDPQQDGVLRLVIISDEAKQVTDGHWSVKFVTKVEAKALSADWSLHLEGTINELMDRATFESGASPNCHGVTWTDDKAQEWVGIPLWLLVGRVDDDIKHEGPAFNDALADMNYTIDVIASDGFSVSFESTRVKRNDNIIVAYLVNGNPLPDKYFPLRLVGSDLAKNEMVGMIEKIVLHVEGLTIPEAAPEATETPAAPAGAGLNITGLVENDLTLTEADLRALEVVKITAEHPKKGPQEYEGVRLSTLLDMAGVDATATKLVFTASDGFSAEVFLTEVQACTDCLVAFTDTEGVFNLVMPGLPSDTWIKDLVKIDLQSATAEATATTEPAPAAGGLLITGLVGNEMTFTEEDLRALEVVKITAEHPKKGPQEYEGVRLSTLLELVTVDATATKLVFTASDDFSAEVSLADVTACTDCLVAFTDTPGVFNLVMPGMPSSTWIKDLVKIEIQ